MPLLLDTTGTGNDVSKEIPVSANSSIQAGARTTTRHKTMSCNSLGHHLPVIHQRST